MSCEAFQDRLLDPEDAEATAHLEQCAACARQANELREALRAVSLPPVSASERAALSGLGAATHARWRRHEHRRVSRQRIFTLALVATAAAVMVLVTPRRHVLPQSPTPATAATAEADSLDPVELTGVAFAADAMDEGQDGPDELAQDDDLDGADL
jgi:hypothetical protein